MYVCLIIDISDMTTNIRLNSDFLLSAITKCSVIPYLLIMVINKLVMFGNSIYKIIFWNESDNKTERSQIIIFNRSIEITMVITI